MRVRAGSGIATGKTPNGGYLRAAEGRLPAGLVFIFV
jgi:hypothetical protein